MKKTLLVACIALVSFSFKPKEMTWVAIGDSITYLNDHADETGDRVTKGYMTLVSEKLPHIHFVNQGHNGWTSGDIAKDIDSLGLAKADVYSIFLGTNDWWQGRPLGTFSDYQNNAGNATVYGSFRIIMNKLRGLNKNARIILITPMQRSDFVYFNGMTNNAYGSYKEKNGQMLWQFADAVKIIGKAEHAAVIDLYHTPGLEIQNLVKFKRLRDPASGNYRNYPYPDYTHVSFDPEKDEYPYPTEAIDMTYDGLHPSDKGYRLIADKLAAIMKKY